MNTQSWYAAKLRFVVLLETTGSENASDSVFLLRSDSFESAFTRALELGRAEETEYVGGTGERVRWRLKEIVSLDVLKATELDGSRFIPSSNRSKTTSATASSTCFSRRPRNLTRPASSEKSK